MDALLYVFLKKLFEFYFGFIWELIFFRILQGIVGYSQKKQERKDVYNRLKEAESSLAM